MTESKPAAGTVLASIPKRPGEEYRLSIEDFRGAMRVNIRVWWQDDMGDWRPSKMGLSMTPAHFRDVWGTLHKADAALKDLGL